MSDRQWFTETDMNFAHSIIRTVISLVYVRIILLFLVIVWGIGAFVYYNHIDDPIPQTPVAKMSFEDRSAYIDRRQALRTKCERDWWNTHNVQYPKGFCDPDNIEERQ